MTRAARVAVAVVLAMAAVVAPLCWAHDGLPVNPALGVPGFPDCVQTNPHFRVATDIDIDRNAHTLRCAPRPARADQIRVACVGDSITAGVHSSGGNHTYPAQLQIMLGDKYVVTNLGACGSTMLKKGNSPFWQRPQYATLTNNTWDVVVIMLGTNDAKDPGSGGPNNWNHTCSSGDTAKLDNCDYASDYADLIEVVRGLGPSTGVPPVIYAAVPPPLMKLDSIGANQTVINTVFPMLIPLINTANRLPHVPIDVFDGMGGKNWHTSAWPTSCTLDTAKTYPPCAWWCDLQSCDQCHPNNNGYVQLASVVKAALLA